MEAVKRVLCLISVMNTGGAETFLMKIYRNLDKTKYQMDFCVNTAQKGFYDDEIKRMGGRIFVIPSKSGNLKGFKAGLTDVVRSNQYEYVLRITSNAMGFMDLKIAKDSGAKRCIARSSNSSSVGGAKARMAHKLGRLLYSRYVDVKIAPSDLAAKYTFGEKIFERGQVALLHNAVDLNQFSYKPDERTKVRAELGVKEGTLLVGHVGRFSKQKNHDFLIDIYEKILRKVPDSRLVLVGTGELQKDIKEKVEKLNLTEKVIFMGVRADVPDLLSAMDVFVFPSFYEGMPNTVIEAQATGLPCVISDTITCEADITGLVHYLPLGDAEAWADYVVQLPRVTRATPMREFKENGYDIESAAEQFAKLIFQ